MTVAVSSSDMNPTFEKTMEFELVVENGCLQDQITVTTGIDDYIYYIDETTSSPTFPNKAGGAENKLWQPQWEQTVEGCPVDYYRYRTLNKGESNEVRNLVTAHETDVLYEYETTQIPIDVPWLSNP